MLSKELLLKNKQRLQDEKDRIEGLLEQVADPDEDMEGDYKAKYPDFGDKDDENASEVEQYETNIAQGRELEDRLRKVNAALERIDAGTYGTCQIGGEEISEDRLRALPEAENCVEHEEE